jgi:hypothetical protein
MKTLQFCMLFMCVITFNQLSAQETVPASGGIASGNDGSVCYTVGQLTYTVCANGNGNVAQTIQQPFEITISTGLEDAKGITLECSVYPNPVNDILVLKINKILSDRLSYQLYDMNGEILRNEIVTKSETSVDLNNLAPSTYLLKIFDNKKELKTFKIIKK